ncbi:MAG: hypoxanthine phosphoribosyltransferase [Alphaproteobacteria bacterium]|nr:hypoxanthine phosphoribosyltransferase [Alphaproteobacteria bacterium]
MKLAGVPSITPLISEQEIHARVRAMAMEIAAAIPQDMLVVALLKGSFIFAADLLRALHDAGVAPQVDFMTASSYGAGMQSSGHVQIQRDLSEEVQGRHVLLIDDILESGHTLHFARASLLSRGAASLHIAVLLEKPGKRTVDISAKFVGFSIADAFVVGYGLDYANYYRELPYIGVIAT